MALDRNPASSFATSAIRLARPKQWAKNVIVFAAILFAGHHPDAGQISAVIMAFFAMSFVSSGTYVFNDLIDVERDRRHPTKRFRPIASGTVSRRAAIGFGAALVLASFGLACVVGRNVVLLLLLYVGLQIAYNVRLKSVAVADVFTIAAGFVLRGMLGAAAIDVGISGWLLFCTGSLALMLGFAKRRNEYILQGADRSSSRESLVHYTRPALDAFVAMFATCAAMSYGIYCLDSRTAQRYPAIILTAIFVFYGIARYTLVVFALDEGGEPADLLFKDKHIIASVLLFIVSAMLALSVLRIPVIEQ